MLAAIRAGIDSAGGVIGATQSAVRVNGAPWAVVGAPVAPHGPSPHNGAVMVSGSATVRANGVPVLRAGDPSSCGHTATGGSGNVYCG